MTTHNWSQTAASNNTADATINLREGQAPSSLNDSARAMMAALAKLRDDLGCKAVTGGSSSTYTLTTNQGFTALSDGLTIGFELHTDCAADPDINVDSLGAVDLIPWTGGTLAAGQLQAGGKYRATYDASAGDWIVHNITLTGIGQGGTGAQLSDPGADRILFWDDSDGAVTWLRAHTGLAISGTDLTLSHLGLQSLTDPGADRVLFWDDSEGTLAWASLSGLAFSTTTFGLDINGLSAKALPVPASDYVAIYDAAGAAHKKTAVNQIGGRVLLATLTASSSSQLVDTSSLTSTYKVYEIEYQNLVPSTTNANLQLTLSVNGGSSYLTSGYRTQRLSYSSAGTSDATAPTTHISLTSSISNTSGNGASGRARIFGPAEHTSAMAYVEGRGVHFESPETVRDDFSGAYATTGSAINALRLAMSSGNIASGTARIYGVIT